MSCYCSYTRCRIALSRNAHYYNEKKSWFTLYLLWRSKIRSAVYPSLARPFCFTCHEVETRSIRALIPSFIYIFWYVLIAIPTYIGGIVSLTFEGNSSHVKRSRSCLNEDVYLEETMCLSVCTCHKYSCEVLLKR